MRTIFAYCDSLCEPNPGKMEGGIWARDDNNHILFSENVPMGTGTCNQAEYYALIHLLQRIQNLTASEKIKLTVHSDSQLMTKQVNGIWKVTKGDIKALYKKVMDIKANYPFELKWIPRALNSMADGLAQQNRLKGSGRKAMMEDGRFKAKRHTPCVEILGDKEMAKLLHNPTLLTLKEEAEILLWEKHVDYQQAATILLKMHEVTLGIKATLPYINNLTDKWIESTITMLSETLAEFHGLAEQQCPTLPSAFAEYFSRLTEKPEPVTEEKEEKEEDPIVSHLFWDVESEIPAIEHFLDDHYLD